MFNLAVLDVKTSLIKLALCLALVSPLVAITPVAAQEQEQELSRSTYDKLSAARKLMQAKQNNQAARDLEALAKNVKDNNYEQAVVLQTLGYAYLDDGDQSSAINAFARSLAQNALPKKTRLEVQYALGQLYAVDGQYEKARDTLSAWIKESKPEARDYVLMANIYAQLNEYGSGIDAIKKALRLGTKPNETHYELLIAMLFQSERYKEGANVLEDMVQIWPDKKQYWTQLADIYLNQNEETKAHSTLQLAYRKGLLRTQSELLMLARLGISAGVPDHAARVIQDGLNHSKIVSTEEHWKLLATAWTRAKEVDKAIDAYSKASEFGNAGEYRLRQAELYMQESDWNNVLTFADKALTSGNLKTPGRAYLLRGMAHIQLQQYSQSLDALQKARKYNETAGPAAQWAEYVQRRQKVQS